MPLVGASQLAALAVAVLQAATPTTPAPPCGCAQFAPDAAGAETEAGAALSANARRLRDFVLFSHRRLGADLVQRQGPWLDTLAGAFPHCADDQVKLAWFRQALASTSDTRVFAERIAQQFDSSLACPLPVR